jgi:hypothetical protein
MELLEREHVLTTLREAHASAARGEGRAVVVLGEPGIGKTTVVTRFLDGLGADARVLRGTCDDLTTPRPLGPLLIAATAMASDLPLYTANASDLAGLGDFLEVVPVCVRPPGPANTRRPGQCAGPEARDPATASPGSCRRIGQHRFREGTGRQLDVGFGGGVVRDGDRSARSGALTEHAPDPAPLLAACADPRLDLVEQRLQVASSRFVLLEEPAEPLAFLRCPLHRRPPGGASERSRRV